MSESLKAQQTIHAFFFSRGLVVVINSADEKAIESRALDIATQQFKEAGIGETPNVIGVAKLPHDGVITAWNNPPKSDVQRGREQIGNDIARRLMGW